MSPTPNLGRAPYRRTLRNEWPTWLVVLAIYGGWGGLTWFWPALPLWLALPCGAWLLAWHNSLQHETIHGHPTALRWLNTALSWPPLGLWLPYALYRTSHLDHHRHPDILTSPLDDPESYYVTRARWSRMNRPMRLLSMANQTLLGRLLLGPALIVTRFFSQEVPLVVRGRNGRRRIWLGHGLGAACVLGWLVAVCHIPVWLYVIGVCYPACSLSLIRSFAEHRADPLPEQRTAIVEAGPLFGLLFLNNNLHALHHAWPGVPWHRLPALARSMTDGEQRGRLYYAGYGEIARRYLLRPVFHPVHPQFPPGAPGV